MTTTPTYSKQTWTDDDPDTPVDAARLGHIEDGIDAATGYAASSLQLGMLAGPGPTVEGGGVATTDPAGVGEQDPKAHTHTVSAGNGSTTQAVNGFDIKGIPSSVVGGRMVYDASSPAIQILRIGKSTGYASDFAIVGAADQTIPDFSVTGFANGTMWDYDLFLVISSTTAAQASAILQAPSGALDHVGWWSKVPQATTGQPAPPESQIITVNQDGQKNIGGFPSSGSGYSVYRQWGSFRFPSGSAAGTMRVLTRQRVGNSDTTFAVRFHSKLILAPAS